MSASVPLQDLPPDVARALSRFGAQPSDLYRALSNHPELAETWIEFAWNLRTRARTPRWLRELMILRSAQMQGAAYQWRDHVAMADEAGVTKEQIDALNSWETASCFDEPTRAALALTDEIVAGSVDDETLAVLAGWFEPGDRIELIITAAFYCMVPRVLDAFRLH